MDTRPEAQDTARCPPPEGRLIRELREKPPRMSGRQAAIAAGISATHWRQIENGWRSYRGHWFAEKGTARTLARMAYAVGATPEELTGAGRPDAAGELEALLTDLEGGSPSPGLSEQEAARREIARAQRAQKAGRRRPA